MPVQKETGTFNGGYNNGELRLDEDTMSAYRGQLRMELTLSEYRFISGVYASHRTDTDQRAADGTPVGQSMRPLWMTIRCPSI